MKRALLSVLLVFFLAKAAEAEPAYPEYPAFEPGKGMAADKSIYSLVFIEKLEAAPINTDVPLELEGLWRVGDSYNSIWLKVEGEGDIPGREGEGEAQLLYSRILTAFFDLQVGMRADLGLDGSDISARPHFVLGLEGLVPYFFELEPAIFVSLEGDISARLEASYDLLITQRLVFTPDIEVNVAVQEVEEWGIGSGLSDLELGARLRYEFTREVAPYIGVNWDRSFAGTTDLAEAAGEPVSETRFMAGARVWW